MLASALMISECDGWESTARKQIINSMIRGSSDETTRCDCISARKQFLPWRESERCWVLGCARPFRQPNDDLVQKSILRKTHSRCQLLLEFQLPRESPVDSIYSSKLARWYCAFSSQRHFQIPCELNYDQIYEDILYTQTSDLRHEFRSPFPRGNKFNWNIHVMYRLTDYNQRGSIRFNEEISSNFTSNFNKISLDSFWIK